MEWALLGDFVVVFVFCPLLVDVLLCLCEGLTVLLGDLQALLGLALGECHCGLGFLGVGLD